VYRRSEGAARHGTRGIKVAGAGFRVESRAGFLRGGILFVQQARNRVPRKVALQARGRFRGPRPNPRRARRIVRFQAGQTVPQPRGILRSNGKWAQAALEATRMADQPRAGLPPGFRQGGIHNLDEAVVLQHASCYHRVLHSFIA